jgi:phage-related protein
MKKVNPMKKIAARFFVTNNGEEPVRTWLKTLSIDDRKVIGKDIQKVEFGWPIGLPVCRPLGDGLWEVRSVLPDGCTARVLFGFSEGAMVLLHGFIKKTKKTPQHDRKLALSRLRALSGSKWSSL